MLRPLRTVLPFVCLPLFLSAGCGTIYTPVYSPGKTNYQKPPEKSVAELLPPAAAGDALHGADAGAGGGANGLPALPDAGAAAPAAPAPGMLDAPPAIPGLPP